MGRKERGGRKQETERVSSVSVSSVARGLVYSRASDDNVHAALNLPLLPPPAAGRVAVRLSFSFLFALALYHIPFLPSCVPELRRVALRPLRLLRLSPSSLLLLLFLLFFVCVGLLPIFFDYLLLLYACRCPLFLYAERRERAYNSRRGQPRKIRRRVENECLYTGN